jgi:Uma2 family endonuclease
MTSEMAVEYRRRPITVDEYHRMVETGIIHPEERVELIEGDIIAMPPIGRNHRSSMNRLTRLLSEIFNRLAVVQIQQSVILSEISEPEPDVALLRWDPTGYAGHDPGPTDTLLLIEVSESSRAYDRRVKLPLYARTGIPEYWQVDIPERCIHVHRDPEGSAYRTNFVVHPGELIAPQAFPDANIAVDEILLA